MGRLVVGGSALLLVVAAAVTMALMPVQRLHIAEVADTTEEDDEHYVHDLYHQCGGEGWTNTSCCAKGCACVAKSQYYSMCKPPSGIDDCDATMLHTQVSAAQDEVTARKNDVRT